MTKRIIDWCVEAACDSFKATGFIEVEADATDEEIESAVSDEVFNCIQWGWSERSRASRRE